MPAAPKKMPVGCWVVFGVCALLLGIIVVGTIVILAHWKGNGGHVLPTPSPGTSDGTDVVYRAPDGGIQIAELTVVGGQQLSRRQLWGPWSDEHHRFALEIDPTFEYEIEHTLIDAGVPISTRESGTWMLTNGAFTLTPLGFFQQGSPLVWSSDGGSVEPSRVWQLEELLLEYQPPGAAPKTTRRIDGLRLSGPVPAWFGAEELNLVLHRGGGIR